jgi:hypothetical protein
MANLDNINIFDYQAPTPEELLAAGPGATVEPISAYESIQAQQSQLSSDPVIRRLQQVGRGIGSFFTPQTPLDILLSGVAPAKAAQTVSKGIQALPKDKDLVFVHNTSEDAIKSFDAMGGIPSPSIAVTKADQPFTGFGNIQLIGKPEKFDPTVNPANKIYSADAYSPRAPKKIRLAKDDAVEQLKKDYKEFIDEGRAGGLEPLGIENLEKLKKGRGAQILNDSSLGFDAFFTNTNIAPEKFLKEIGRDTKNWQEKAFPQKRYNEWVKKEKDKYLSQDGVFTVFDDLEQTMVTKPYTLDNVVENMVQETQRGGEGGLDTFGANRLRALMSEQFKDLPDIKARKDMLTPKEQFSDLFDDVHDVLIDAVQDDTGITEDVFRGIGEQLMTGSKNIDDAVRLNIKDLDWESPKQLDAAVSEITNKLRLNTMRPVQYFEAKPTRAVGFDEFAGAIVPEGTSKEVIDILEKRGLKVVTQKFKDMDSDYGKGKIRQQFKDQFFSIGLPATGATALGIQNTDIFQDDNS